MEGNVCVRDPPPPRPPLFRFPSITSPPPPPPMFYSSLLLSCTLASSHVFIFFLCLAQENNVLRLRFCVRGELLSGGLIDFELSDPSPWFDIFYGSCVCVCFVCFFFLAFHPMIYYVE